MLPHRMVERYREIVPDIRDFVEWMGKKPRRAFRINHLKAPDNIMERVEWMVDGEVPGIRDAYYARDVPIGNTLEHFMGYIYVQEPSSMLPPVVLSPEPGMNVLDMAAAPGSKTTQIADMMKNRGWILAVEKSMRRMKALADNIERLGVLNATMLNADARFLPNRMERKFDRVLLDAPCSAEGMMPKARIAWSRKRILQLSSLQKHLALTAFRMLKKGGIMVYSTCTGAPEENEGVVNHILKKFPNARLERISVKGWKFREGVVEFGNMRFDEEVKKCARVYPQDNMGAEMFFMAKLRKK